MLTRRSFLSTSASAGVALGLPAFGQGSSPTGTRVRVGLVGCGGRGNGALRDFKQACQLLGLDVEVTALGDAFPAKALQSAAAHGVPAERCFGGFDAYHKVIDSGCHYVLFATPPSFRPLHFEAAVAAGKHCFIEKPVAVDPVGARKMIQVGEQAAAKGLAVVAGTQRRHTLGYLKNKSLIDAGAIGEIKGGVIQWNGQVPWVRRREPGQSDAEYLASNWLNFTELSGDHIVEQHVHNIDVAVWFLGRLPVSAVGFGGRARRETGNQFDFFSVDYDFGQDVHIHSQCRQMPGTYARIGEMFTGTEGVCLGGGKLTGRKVSVPDLTLDTDNGMVQEHVDLIRSVMAGKPLNHARRIAEVTMVAIMGRISAYTGEMVRWNDLVEKEDSPYFHLALSPQPAEFEGGAVVMPPEVAPIPGKA